MSLKINGEMTDRVEEFKYLGLTLDSSLTFTPHLDRIYRKACQQLGAICKVRKCLNANVSTMLYKSLMIPTFDYGDVVYSCATKEALNKLQIVQNRACRVISREGRRTNVETMHK